MNAIDVSSKRNDKRQDKKKWADNDETKRRPPLPSSHHRNTACSISNEQDAIRYTTMRRRSLRAQEAPIFHFHPHQGALLSSRGETVIEFLFKQS